jgi:hypothetical protein
MAASGHRGMLGTPNHHYLAHPHLWDSRCFRAGVRREERSVPLIERNRALELRGTRAIHPGPRATKRRPQRAPMLNSARRHCTSPRRGRRVEWSDQRRGIRFHFRPRRFCRWCASDASYESVGNAGSIDVTTSDIPLRTDSVKRCKG